jgi:hypothetical protein
MHRLDGASGDPRVVVAGNIFTFIPGSFCLWCCGFLTREKIDAEQNGPTRGYFEKNRHEAQVVSFNGVLASQAVTESSASIPGPPTASPSVRHRGNRSCVPIVRDWIAPAPHATCRTSALRLLASLVLASNTSPPAGVDGSQGCPAGRNAIALRSRLWNAGVRRRAARSLIY